MKPNAKAAGSFPHNLPGTGKRLKGGIPKIDVSKLLADATKGRDDDQCLGIAPDEEAKIKELGLMFENITGLPFQMPCDFQQDKEEEKDQDEQEWCDAHETAMEATGGGASIDRSGPTTVSAKLRFPCPRCGEMLLLKHLMPTMINDVLKDLCYNCFVQEKGDGISKKQFQLDVCCWRKADIAGLRVQDAYRHTPLESMIFNSYKSLEKNGTPEQKKKMKMIG